MIVQMVRAMKNAFLALGAEFGGVAVVVGTLLLAMLYCQGVVADQPYGTRASAVYDLSTPITDLTAF